MWCPDGVRGQRVGAARAHAARLRQAERAPRQAVVAPVHEFAGAAARIARRVGAPHACAPRDPPSRFLGPAPWPGFRARGLAARGGLGLVPGALRRLRIGRAFPAFLDPAVAFLLVLVLERSVGDAVRAPLAVRFYGRIVCLFLKMLRMLFRSFDGAREFAASIRHSVPPADSLIVGKLRWPTAGAIVACPSSAQTSSAGGAVKIIRRPSNDAGRPC